ncbi:ExeA family protein [Vibrio rumoiensis]|uniref:General secretion pathway protein GspA n=1 Tax=Vibrio rumoiensis 1S-45 TaxID=1188252 RepID=A0A1E5E235_9VIBR|nr:ExeA family protein [Vibrio rumoiensis]OEF25472.1 general secretion pathway protein GspA [Vibrio rumoiensis 1S-45]
MYKDFFGLSELPFTIVPSSRYIFLSARHREAMNHLQAGLGGGGGFALLTGEVGTGKTTVSKALLSVLESNIKTGLILNPTYTSIELLESICDEFSIEYQTPASLKQLTQAIYQYLLDNHAQGIQTLLLIDEAQHLSADVLEQLRLLTNLETESQKLLRVLLIGQPELQYKLQTEELRQLAQRITGRYHLLPLTDQEVAQYIQFRLQVAGCRYEVFSTKAVKAIAKQTQGVPRLINLVCDKCMLYAYYGGEASVSGSVAEKACEDVMTFQRPIGSHNPLAQSGGQYAAPSHRSIMPYLLSLSLGLMLAAGAWFVLPSYISSLSAMSPSSENLLPMETEQPAVPVEQAFKEEAAPNSTMQQTNLNALLPREREQTASFSGVDDIISPLVTQSHNPIAAMQTLFSLWGYQVSSHEANCRDAERGELYCYQQSGNLTDLATINRPAMLTLQDQYRTYFSVLYRLTDTHAQLLLAGKRVEVPIEWLKKHWSGEYQLLWHSDMADQTLKLYSQGEEVQKLNRLLSQVLGEPLSATERFDQTVKTKVEAFQMWQGIDVDGIAGKKTLMLLDSYVNRNAPVIVAKIDDKDSE